MRPVLGRMGKTSDNQGVDYFLGKSKCFGYPMYGVLPYYMG